MAGEKPTKGTHGGKRPGAGRRPKEIRDARDACNRAMDKVVIPEFERIFRTLVDMAAGTPDARPVAPPADPQGPGPAAARRTRSSAWPRPGT
jgi:hypothetical protein